ncbi:hypothetical protein HDA40_008139 [Hamadaea flava]|uniref:Lipoprotein n=1 Tax=Hamadaea flava TaxID=1742688 RepID=A0ABV8LLN4_9ACTN|nr:hypothetical protein [Hamadaea flava]MCP2329632.1 hypothetical protein [Hamadaea flava]
MSLVLAAGCSDDKVAEKPPTVRASVQAGQPVKLADETHHLVVEAAADALPPGDLVIAGAAPAKDKAVVRDAVSITTDSGEPVAGAVTLTFTVPATAPDTATVAYLESTTQQWIPVPSQRSGTTLTAESSHLTDFGWFDDLRLGLGQMLGTRAAAPTCGGRPAWFKDLVIVPSADAQIFACAESAGSDVRLKVVNNRAFPVGLELSAKPSSITSPMWPTTLVELLNSALTRTLKSDRTIALPPFGEVDLTYRQPTDPVHVTGYVRTDIAVALLTVLLNAALDISDFDLVMPGGKKLGVAVLNCFGSLLSSTKGLADGVRTTNRGLMITAIANLAGCFEEVFKTERAALAFKNPDTGVVRVMADKKAQYLRLSKALDAVKYYELAKAAAQLADLAIDTWSKDVREGADVSATLDSPPRILLTGTTVGKIRVDSTAADIEKRLKDLFGAPTKTSDWSSCSLGGNPEARRSLEWGALEVTIRRPGRSNAQLVGWTVRPGKLPDAVRLPYNVTTSMTVKAAMKAIPDASGEWLDTFEMYLVTTPRTSSMTWAGDRADGSGKISYISNMFEPCD